MSKSEPKQCPRCHQMVAFWFNRKVCVHCRRAEKETPEHKAKAKIWRLVNDAIRSEKLKRGPCEVCGAAKTDAHHDDYTKPFSVRWLCRAHHRQHHKQSQAA